MLNPLYRLVAWVLALLVLVAGGWYIGHLRAEVQAAQEATRTAQEALKRTQATLAYRERLRATTARETAAAKASLQAATASNPTWATAPVPKEVQDALCAHLDCRPGPDGLQDDPTDRSP